MTETIYDALRESHEIQRALCRRLVRAKPGDRSRETLQRELRLELAAHAAAEERYLYVPILMDDMGLNSSRHAIGEHHEMDELVEDLYKAATDGELWLEVAKKLSHKVFHHLKEEEKKFFQVSGKILTESQKTGLAGKYRRDYRRMYKSLASK